MRYISTRGGAAPQTFTDVLLSGMAPDGGLFVPETWPRLDMDALRGASYADVAMAVIAPFVEPDISRADLKAIIDRTYGADVFVGGDPAPLRDLGDGLHLMELFHGPTLAFKDVALQFLGRVFDHVLAKTGRHITIVGATSGDTGSAAIEACRDRATMDVFILHPHGRTSDIQRRQMTSVLASNIHNIAIDGTFDDAQAIVKALFADRDLQSRVSLSAINSINWARIIAQSVYYVRACLALGPCSFAVPTGNFGNIYAAYVARALGAPVRDLIIGSNRNDILTRFFEMGEMRVDGVVPSLSPSMDIQVSSNFERYLFDLLARDGAAVASVMDEFSRTGRYGLPASAVDAARGIFRAYRCDDDRTLSVMAGWWTRSGQLVDPHTAVGLHAAACARADGVSGPIVALACAHPAKFPDAVAKATGQRADLPESLADLPSRPEKYDVLAADNSLIKQYIIDKSIT